MSIHATIERINATPGFHEGEVLSLRREGDRLSLEIQCVYGDLETDNMPTDKYLMELTGLQSFQVDDSEAAAQHLLDNPEEYLEIIDLEVEKTTDGVELKISIEEKLTDHKYANSGLVALADDITFEKID